MNNFFHQVKNNDLQQLKARIRNAVTTITHNMLQNLWIEVEYRLDTSRAPSATGTDIY